MTKSEWEKQRTLVSELDEKSELAKSIDEGRKRRQSNHERKIRKNGNTVEVKEIPAERPKPDKGLAKQRTTKSVNSNLEDMITGVEERFIELSTAFDRTQEGLLPGKGPEQKLAPTETGGFPNTLVYKMKVDAPPWVCHEMFCEGVFGEGQSQKHVNKAKFEVGQVRRLAGDIWKGDVAYHWVIAAKSLLDSKEINKPLDTVLRGQTTTTITEKTVWGPCSRVIDICWWFKINHI